MLTYSVHHPPQSGLLCDGFLCPLLCKPILLGHKLNCHTFCPYTAISRFNGLAHDLTTLCTQNSDTLFGDYNNQHGQPLAMKGKIVSDLQRCVTH